MVGKFRFSGWMKAMSDNKLANHRIVALDRKTAEILYCHNWIYKAVRFIAMKSKKWEALEDEEYRIKKFNGIGTLQIIGRQTTTGAWLDNIHIQKRKDGDNVSKQGNGKNPKRRDRSGVR